MIRKTRSGAASFIVPLLLAALACANQPASPPGQPAVATPAAEAAGRSFSDGAFYITLPDWPEIALPDADTLLAVANQGRAITLARYEAVPRALGEHFARVLPDYGAFQSISLAVDDPGHVVLDADLGGDVPQHARMFFLYCGGVSYRITGSAAATDFDRFVAQLQQVLAQAVCMDSLPPVPDSPGLIGLVANPIANDYSLPALHQSLMQARQIGVQATHIYLQWADVEKAPGVYDWAIADQLIDPPALVGLRLSLVINFIHTSVPGPTPSDLAGRSFADPDYVARAAAFVAAVAERYSGQLDYLALGNEVNIYFAAHPEALTPYLTAWAAMRAAVRAARPGLPTGITLAFHEALRENAFASFDPFRQGDFLAYTYYPHGQAFSYDVAPDSFAVALEQMIAVSGNTPFIIVENGFATAPSLGGNEARQVAYIEATFAALTDHRDVFGRHIWYALHDGQAEVCAQAARSFFPADFDPTANVAPETWQRFQDYLCTLGLKHNDGLPKPGLEAFQEAIETYQAEP